MARILLVGNAPSFTSLIPSLKNAGHTVDHAATGPEVAILFKARHKRREVYAFFVLAPVIEIRAGRLIPAGRMANALHSQHGQAHTPFVIAEGDTEPIFSYLTELGS